MKDRFSVYQVQKAVALAKRIKKIGTNSYEVPGTAKPHAVVNGVCDCDGFAARGSCSHALAVNYFDKEKENG